MEEEKRNIEFKDKKLKIKFFDYKILIWTVFGFLVLSTTIFLVLFINYKNKENDSLIDEFSGINSSIEAPLDQNK